FGAKDLRESFFRGEVIDARFLVEDVEWHGQVILSKQPVGEPPHVGNVQGETGLQFPAYRKIQRVGIGGLQVVVDAPGDCSISRWIRLRIAARGCGTQDGSWSGAVVLGWDGVHAGKARGDQGCLEIRSVVERSGETKRAVLVECIHEAFTDPIVDDSKSSANAALPLAPRQRSQKAGSKIGRPRQGKARRKIVVVPIVEAGL